MSKLNQTWYGVSPVYIEYKMKKIFATAGLEKKLVFIRKFATISKKLRSMIFKIRSFSSGQGVVQIQRKFVWGILYLPRV